MAAPGMYVDAHLTSLFWCLARGGLQHALQAQLSCRARLLLSYALLTANCLVRSVAIMTSLCTYTYARAADCQWNRTHQCTHAQTLDAPPRAGRGGQDLLHALRPQPLPPLSSIDKCTHPFSRTHTPTTTPPPTHPHTRCLAENRTKAWGCRATCWTRWSRSTARTAIPTTPSPGR